MERRRSKSKDRNKNVVEVEEKYVDCPFKIAGCKEKLEKGSGDESDHISTCDFRPIPCLVHQSCNELVPYHIFNLHMHGHFLTPLFCSTLTTPLVFEQDDFGRDQSWLPRWMNCYNKDFFIMACHRNPDIWYFWVCMLASQDEADGYYYDITVCQGENRKSATYSVLSIRTEMEDIEKKEVSMSITNFEMKRLSQIGDNVYGSVDIDLVIYKLHPATSRIRLTENC